MIRLTVGRNGNVKKQHQKEDKSKPDTQPKPVEHKPPFQTNTTLKPEKSTKIIIPDYESSEEVEELYPCKTPELVSKKLHSRIPSIKYQKSPLQKNTLQLIETITPFQELSKKEERHVIVVNGLMQYK